MKFPGSPLDYSHFSRRAAAVRSARLVKVLLRGLSVLVAGFAFSVQFPQAGGFAERQDSDSNRASLLSADCRERSEEGSGTEVNWGSSFPFEKSAPKTGCHADLAGVGSRFALRQHTGVRQYYC